MEDIYAIRDRKTGDVLKNTMFPNKQLAKIDRDKLNLDEHKDKWEELTHNGTARYCVVMSSLHPKNQ